MTKRALYESIPTNTSSTKYGVGVLGLCKLIADLNPKDFQDPRSEATIADIKYMLAHQDSALKAIFSIIWTKNKGAIKRVDATLALLAEKAPEIHQRIDALVVTQDILNGLPISDSCMIKTSNPSSKKQKREDNSIR